jgi:hypothetical protein
MIHEQRQLGLRLLMYDPDASDVLQHLVRGHPGNMLRRAWWPCRWGMAPLIPLRLPGLRTRLTLPPWHALQPARRDATVQAVLAPRHPPLPGLPKDVI